MAGGDAQDIFDNKIVDAYFGGSSKTVSKAKKRARSKTTQGISAGIALSLFFLTAFFVFKYVILPQNTYPNKNDSQTIASAADKIIDAGFINRYLVKRLSFEGGAKESAILKDRIMLVNEDGSRQASLDLELSNPVDLNDGLLFIKGNTASGIRHVDLVLTDSENNIYRVTKISFSPKGEISGVPLEKGAGCDIDFGKIEKLSIEFGTETTGNARGTILYIRDLYLRKLL